MEIAKIIEFHVYIVTLECGNTYKKVGSEWKHLNDVKCPPGLAQELEKTLQNYIDELAYIPYV